MPQDDDQAALRAAIQKAIANSGMIQREFGAEVAHHEGVPPYDQRTVAGWFSKPVTFPPRRVFAIEKALKLRPGTLSKIEGYLPAGAAPVVTVEEALAADPDISTEQASMIEATVRVARESTRQRRLRRAR